MLDFSTAPVAALLAEEGHPCACGKVHRAGVKAVHIGSGMLQKAAEALLTLGATHPFIVCDENTWQAAGEAVCLGLSAAAFPYTRYVFPAKESKLEPDEYAVGALLMAYPPACDAIVAVGSGVIGDCCKVLAHAVGRPMVTVATAPSMDGFASASSAMVQNGVKVTLYNRCPEIILLDTDVLCRAPERMLWAGLGDMLAKYISICEWRISRLITGEYFCENIAALVRRSLARCVRHADGLARRDPEAVAAVAEGLVLSGVAMNFAEVSRPASGLEHYYSHLWEMFALMRGEPSDLHGIQVGVGTLLTLDLLEAIQRRVPDRAHAERMMRSFNPAAWEADIREIFGPVSETVIAMERDVYHKNDADAHAERLNRILDSWPEILSIMKEELPRASEIRALMEGLSMPTTPGDLSIGEEDTRRALIGSREIRDKYMTSSLLWDLGWLYAI